MDVLISYNGIFELGFQFKDLNSPSYDMWSSGCTYFGFRDGRGRSRSCPSNRGKSSSWDLADQDRWSHLIWRGARSRGSRRSRANTKKQNATFVMCNHETAAEGPLWMLRLLLKKCWDARFRSSDQTVNRVKILVSEDLKWSATIHRHLRGLG